MAFRGLQAESAVQGEAHKAIAKELQTLVWEPFEEWAHGHKVCYSCVVVEELSVTDFRSGTNHNQPTLTH